MCGAGRSGPVVGDRRLKMHVSTDSGESLSGLLSRARSLAPGVAALAGGVDPDGHGLFATDTFQAGQPLARLGGALVHHSRIDDWVRATGAYGLQVHDDWYVCPEARAEIQESGAINHSCEPNVGMGDALTFVALQRIDGTPERPVELLIDYAMTGSPAGGFTDCQCGSSQCRGQVTRSDWQIPELQRRYSRHFPPFKRRRLEPEADVQCRLTRYLDRHGGELDGITRVDGSAGQ
jgi:hypothetical protein